MEHVRNEELLPFHKLTAEEQQILEGEVHKGNVEWFGRSRREWYQVDTTDLYPWAIYRTVSQEEQEMQHEENNEFPWHMVSSEWNALARDDYSHTWYLYKDKPYKGDIGYAAHPCIMLSEVAQNVIGVDMSQWGDIPWNDSLMLRPGYEQQDSVIARLSELMDNGPAVGSVDETELKQLVAFIQSYEQAKFQSSTTEEYPVVKLKNLHKLSIGDVVRLKKTGELIEVCEYSEIGCSGCKFSAYYGDQHPCSKCETMKNAYVDYKEPTETQDETFANTEMKVYVDLDDKTKQLLRVKQKEGKVQWLQGSIPPVVWIKKIDDLFFRNSVYRVV